MEEKSLPIVSVRMSFLDWPTPDGVATVVYIAGCKHNCPGCHSPELLDGSKFMEIPISDAVEVIANAARENRTFNVVLSGGDPLYRYHDVQFLVNTLIEKDRRFRFCIYTGFEFDEAKHMINGYDFIITGAFDCKLYQPSGKTDEKMVIASKNQKIFDASGKLLSKNGVLKF